ncbi:hypothetical protein TCAP_02048 [Tolypocladium capitatum]|uniref:Uncharacterized protein n=1 Tax=Tolypocladium capitatum TaxID=45235 RepID=A0A2K3QKG1_9HYPO|nr:hypothetical protein TCAP_02048 [Tolypocladium capitatum]
MYSETRHRKYQAARPPDGLLEPASAAGSWRSWAHPGRRLDTVLRTSTEYGVRSNSYLIILRASYLDTRNAGSDCAAAEVTPRNPHPMPSTPLDDNDDDDDDDDDNVGDTFLDPPLSRRCDLSLLGN